MSPEVSADRRITFRINAPQARTVRVSGSDIPGLGQNGVMTKAENGIWTFTSAPVPPGAYRYNINVDGVAVIDPRNPLTSVSNTLRAAPVFGSVAPYTTRPTRAWMIAPAHITHGSSVTYSVEPGKR